MSKTDPAVQHAIANTSAVYQAILNLWAMTPIELKMYVTAMFIISIVLQYYKKSFLTHLNRKDKVRELWKISFPISILLSVSGYYIYEGSIHFGYFILTGLTASTISMGIHRVAVDYIWPAIKIIVSALFDRVSLIIRGKTKDA